MNKIPAVYILALLLLLAACGTKTDSPTIPAAGVGSATLIAEGHLAPIRALNLVFPARGRVAEVLVATGEQVSAGQVLVRLADSEQAAAALAAAEVELLLAQQEVDLLARTVELTHAQAWQAYLDAQEVRASAQLAWDRLDLNAIQTEIDNARADVTDRQTEVEEARDDLNNYIDLPVENATRKSYEDRLRTAQTNLDTAQQKLEAIIIRRDQVRINLDTALNLESEARRRYENTMETPDPDQFDLAQARLVMAQAREEAARVALENYELKAPFSGQVMDVPVEVGEWAGPEAVAVAVADLDEWIVETSDLSELDVVDLRVGQSVEVIADALPEVVLSGVVETISAAPKVQGGDILYTVRIRVDEPDPNLRWGMTVEVSFLLDEQ